MKHRQEKTPTPFELCCGLYQSQINPVRRDNTKEVQEAQLCKKVWSGIPPALRTHQNNGESWHSSKERNNSAGDVLAQQKSGISQTVLETHLRQGQEQA